MTGAGAGVGMTLPQLLRAALRHDKGGLFAVLLVPVGLWVVAMIGSLIA